MSTKVLICGSIHLAHEKLKQLQEHYPVVNATSKNKKEFLEGFKSGGAYEGTVAIYRTHDSCIGPFDKELVDSLPSSVRFICHNGAGYDSIDVNTCAQRGIQVSHTPGSVDNATATTGMYLLLSVLRNFYVGERTAREGNWLKNVEQASDPEYKTLGIVGMGGIGRAMARRAAAFDMKIIYHNRKRLSEQDEIISTDGTRATYCSTLKELLAKADVVSLHVPLNTNTKRFLNAECFEQMKKGAVLINTARGGVVDEEALIAALESGHLGGAGLDVFPNEPEIHEKLRKCDRVSLLPHMGTHTNDSRKLMEEQVFKNIKSALETGHVINLVPEQQRE